MHTVSHSLCRRLLRTFFEPIFCSTAVMALSTARKRPATSPPPRIKPVSTAAADTPSAPTESAIVESAQVGETEERLALDMMVMLVVLRSLATSSEILMSGLVKEISRNNLREQRRQ